MNLLLIKTTFVVFTLILNSDQAKPTEPTGNKSFTRSKNKIMKAILMQCSENVDASQENIHVVIQIGEHMTKTLDKTNNDSSVGRILVGEMSNPNANYTCDLRTPSLVDVSNEDFVLMYPLHLESIKSEVRTLDKIPKKADSMEIVKNAEHTNHLNDFKDVHNANNVELLDDIYTTRLKPSDFLKRSDFMQANPKDFRRDSICTKNFRKDNNKNNANNEYANEEFYGDKNQRENENAFSGKFQMNLNNNEIDNFKSDKKNTFENIIINDIGYFTKNLVDDKDSRKRRKNEHKNDFIKCVGMKNFKKIDQVLCTCARNVDEVNEDEIENDEGNNCAQLINNMCLWGPVSNKNINYEMKKNEARRNLYYGNITPTACCYLLPPFYLTLGRRCVKRFIKGEDDYDDEKYIKWPEITKSVILDSWPEIIKDESNKILDRTTSFIHSTIEKNEEPNKNTFFASNLKSLLNVPEYNSYPGNTKRYKNKQARNRINIERFQNFDSVPIYDNIDDDNEISEKPVKHRKFKKRDPMSFDKVIYDPHLNIADKMQLINMISPKRPCESSRLNHHTSYHDLRQKRNLGMPGEFSLTDDEHDSGLKDYEFQYPDSKERKKFSNGGNATINYEEKSVRMMQTICSQHPCALAMPFKKDPYFRGEMKFFDNNGSSLSSKKIAENICRDHFNEFILIPLENTNGTN